MLIVGLTGNIGSGKSSVSRLFKDLGAAVLDTDQVARDVVVPGTEGLTKLVELFGNSILNPDGSLNRLQTAEIVFGNQDKLKQLNGIVHPAIREVLTKVIAEYRAEPKEPLLIIEAPLLIEVGLYKMVDQVWLVTVDEQEQIQRVMGRDQATLEQVLQRIEAQMPQKDKIPYADIVIDNSGDLNSVEQQVSKIWSDLVGSP